MSDKIIREIGYSKPPSILSLLVRYSACTKYENKYGMSAFHLKNIQEYTSRIIGNPYKRCTHGIKILSIVLKTCPLPK